jgi:hypothetical protein
MRRLAAEAMGLFEDFTPLLVGDALEGTVHANSAIVLQLFAEFPEQVIFKLHAARIPFSEMALPRRSRKPSADPAEPSGFSFLVDGVTVELQVYPAHTRLPSGRLKGAAARESGANLQQLLQLLPVTFG